jgi:hypothetical protein
MSQRVDFFSLGSIIFSEFPYGSNTPCSVTAAETYIPGVSVFILSLFNQKYEYPEGHYLYNADVYFMF